MPTEGEIHPTRHFGIATIFQQPQLLPHLTAEENIILPLSSFLTEEKARRIAQKHLQEMEMEPFGNRYPKELSYGQQQRIAIARALAYPSPLLLMDEPFGALDAQTRYQMEEEVLRIWEKEKRTVIFVTNNIEEAVYLGDRIVLLSRCPATIKQIYDVPLPRPRDYVDPEFLAIREAIEANTDLAL